MCPPAIPLPAAHSEPLQQDLIPSLPRGTKRAATSSPASLTPDMSPAVEPLQLSAAEEPATPVLIPPKAEDSPTSTALSISAKPFQPASPDAIHPSLNSAAECEWELCRVREFWCEGNISDYEELEELEAEQRPVKEEQAEEEDDSDYGDDKSSDTEDCEVTRALELRTFRCFSKSLASKSKLLAVVGVSAEESVETDVATEA